MCIAVSVDPYCVVVRPDKSVGVLMIYVLTYDHPHRKTEDLLYRLHATQRNVTVLALPWEDRKPRCPLYHLELADGTASPEQLAKHLGFDFEYCDLKGRYGTVLIGGAGILPGDFIDKNRVINVHPGWLPLVRGLDSLKWAIYDGMPIGVTVHQICGEVDLGFLSERVKIPLKVTDSFHSIAARQYNRGLDMLVANIDKCDRGGSLQAYLGIRFEKPREPTRRMNHITELVMIKRLEQRLIA